MERASDVQARPEEAGRAEGIAPPAEDELARIFIDAVRAARDNPQLLQRHGLPVPTPQLCNRALLGYVPPGTSFPASTCLYDNLGLVLGVDRIVSGGGASPFRLAEHGEAGELAVIQCVTATGEPGDCDPLDLVAWVPSRPWRWWLLYGVGAFLGPWPPAGAELELVSTPMAWCRRPHTCCLLRHDIRVMEPLLGFRRVLVDDQLFAARLSGELATAFLPSVEVRR